MTTLYSITLECKQTEISSITLYCVVRFTNSYCYYYYTCLASFLQHNHDVDSDSLPVCNTMTAHDDQQQFCCLITYKSILDCTRLAMNLHISCITQTSPQLDGFHTLPKKFYDQTDQWVTTASKKTAVVSKYCSVTTHTHNMWRELNTQRLQSKVAGLVSNRKQLKHWIIGNGCWLSKKSMIDKLHSSQSFHLLSALSICSLLNFKLHVTIL